MKRAFGYFLIFSVISLKSIAQVSEQYFWRGKLMQSKNEKKQIYLLVNDSLYALNDKAYTFKNKISVSTSNLVKIIIDSTNTFWFVSSNSISYSKDEGKNWATIKSPPTYISNVKIYSSYLYIKDYSKLYRIDLSKSTSEWELVYSGDRLQDFVQTNDGTLFISEYMFAIYKSIDNGKSFSKTSWNYELVPSTPGVLEISGNRLFVGSWWHGIYYSDDQGITWKSAKSKTNPIDYNSNINGNINAGISKIDFDKNGLVFAFASDQKSAGGYYFSLDNGKNFEKLETGLSIWEEQFITDIAFNDSSIYLNAGYRGIFRSKDNGKSWSEVNNGINNKKPHHVCKLISNSKGDTYAFMALQLSIGRSPNSFWGIMKSSDSMKTWNYISDNLREEYMSIQDFIINKADHLIVSGYNPGTILKSIDDGATWTKCKINTVGSTVGFFGKIKNNQYADTLYAGTWWDGIIRSLDGGDNWVKLTNGLPIPSGNELNPKAVDIYSTGDTVYAILVNSKSYEGIYRSFSSGNSWTKISSNTWDNILKIDSLILVSKSNSFYKSTNEGISWSAVIFPTGTTFSKINQQVAYDSSNKISSIKYGKVIFATNNGLFITSAKADTIQRVVNKNITAFDYNFKNHKLDYFSNGSSQSAVQLPVIFGPDELCISENPKYTTNIAGGTWSLNDNQSGRIDSTGKLSVYRIGKFTVSYLVKNIDGIELSATKSISIKPSPPTPTLTKDADGFLVSSSLTKNYWQKDGIIIDSLSSKLKPTTNGLYTVKVLGSSCFSLPSNSYYYLVNSIQNSTINEKLSIFPNPSFGELKIIVPNIFNGPFSISIIDLHGRKYFEKTFMSRVINLSIKSFPTGNYSLIVRKNTGELIYSNMLIKN